MPVTCGRSVVFSGYSGFLHQINWSSRCNWNIVESGVKHHNPNPCPLSTSIVKTILPQFVPLPPHFPLKYKVGLISGLRCYRWWNTTHSLLNSDFVDRNRFVLERLENTRGVIRSRKRTKKIPINNITQQRKLQIEQQKPHWTRVFQKVAQFLIH